ncbi:MAG TPA: nitrate/sulfonate/bicarbonate ABC transporter ATP-binding protein [Bryobacteraceae bacterium]|jgi:NitT/TauT family transport system ATP-binding protein|nr:nitrate/sulfonate/bicarbonate ABC transporter ATP-binding protein [Bryobacteraceae bacterium]
MQEQFAPGVLAEKHSKTEILAAHGVAKTFPVPDGELTVLEDISLHILSGEVVALLGRSGSGKSTLLRILAGLIRPSRGEVMTAAGVLRGANPGVAMVFQSFALLPWLTVQENTELGLYARGTEKAETEKAALRALRMVGLEGFGGAYPRELSGGMKQRVGFARAFVMEPDVLMMDEPFSALDVLTAENLRGEISDLWEAGKFPAKSILLVTHNIEEAVLLSDRVLILGANPGRIRGELMIDIPRPRQIKNPRFAKLVDYIYTVMTNPHADVGQAPSRGGGFNPRFPLLPHARVGGISGLLEIIAESGGCEDLPKLAERLRLEIDDLLPTVDAAVLLGFATLSHGDVIITEEGKSFATADVEQSWQLFQKQLLAHVPFISTILQGLKQKQNGTVKREFFVDILDEHFSQTEAEEQLDTLINWGRYAHLFEYDADEERLYLPEIA